MTIQEEYVKAINDSDTEKALEIIQEPDFAQYVNEKFCEHKDEIDKIYKYCHLFMQLLKTKALK